MPATLSPVRPAAPIRAKYERRLLALVDEMHRSLVYWITAEYRANQPEVVLLASDKSPASAMRAIIAKVGKRWLQRFDEMAPKLADYFATAVKDRNDRALMADLRKAGMTVRFKMTAAMNDAYQAVRAENVNLIRSIAQQHLTQVETLVMQSVQQGRDLGTLTKELTARYGVTKRRAAFIALDQNNRATAVMAKVRHLELGITKAKWLHSAGGKTPRPEHVAFSGKTYDIAKGHDFGDGAGPVWPGTEINCFPGETLIDLMNGCHEIWRYHYRGDLFAIETGQSAVWSTPNHPFLTDEGWVAAQAVNEGDYVWKARLKESDSGVRNVDERQVTIEQVFLTLQVAIGVRRSSAAGFDFHGDVPDSDVESIRADPSLMLEWYASIQQGVAQLPLALPDVVARRIVASQISHTRFSGGIGDGLPAIRTQASKAQAMCLSRRTLGQPGSGKSLANQGPRNAEMVGNGESAPTLVEQFGDGIGADILKIGDRVNSASEHDPLNDFIGDAELASDLGDSHAPAIHLDNIVDRKINASGAGLPLSIGRRVTGSAESLAQLVRINSQMGSKLFEAGEFVFERVRVSKKLVRINASTHVYTIQSATGWFCAGQDSIATKNCRCVAVPVVPGFDD